MHRAKCSWASFWLSEMRGLPPLLWNLQVFAAAWNAGPLKAMPSTVMVELPGVAVIESPSPPGPLLGSGKLGTPCARMHCEVASSGSVGVLAFRVAPPQAATVVAHAAAMTVIQTPCTIGLAPVGVRRWRTPGSLSVVIAIQTLYAASRYTAISLLSRCYRLWCMLGSMFGSNRLRATVRWRWTLLYAALFAGCGVALLTVTYVLVAHAPVTPAHRPVSTMPPSIRRVLLSPSGQAALRVVGSRQRVSDLHRLVIESAIALAITAIVAIAAGWILAGRMLRPLRTITATAKRISHSNLHERLAFHGARDELRELADTIDELLERLERAFEAQRRFVANASHELRTPLTMMRATLDVARAKPEGAPAQLRALDASLREDLDQAGRLLESFLELASAEGNELGELTAVSLDHAVTASVELQAGPIAEKHLDVETTIRPVSISGSETLIKRMITNVIDNAILHTPPGGAVHVRCAPEERSARLVVENSGPALDPLAVAELAQPFRRLGSDLTGLREGFGLGLSIVSAIANAHGGRLALSARETGGMRVEITLPNATIAASAGARS
jgi:signal transduction histidine kinase